MTMRFPSEIAIYCWTRQYGKFSRRGGQISSSHKDSVKRSLFPFSVSRKMGQDIYVYICIYIYQKFESVRLV